MDSPGRLIFLKQRSAEPSGLTDVKRITEIQLIQIMKRRYTVSVLSDALVR